MESEIETKEKIVNEQYAIFLQREQLYRLVLKEYCDGNIKHAKRIFVKDIANGDSLFIPHMALGGMGLTRYVINAERPEYVWISNVNNVKKDSKGRASIEKVMCDLGYLHPDCGTTPEFINKFLLRENLEVHRLELS